MTLAAKRKLAYTLLGIGIVGFIFSVKYYDFDKKYSDMYTERFGDKLERSLKKAAGDDAFACARIFAKKNIPIVAACADGADAAHHNFYASFNVETENGKLNRGIARDPSGGYTEFSWKPSDKEASAIYLGTDPVKVACASPPVYRHNFQGVPTCTDE